MAVLAPIPKASVRTTTAANPGALASRLVECRKSCQNVSIVSSTGPEPRGGIRTPRSTLSVRVRLRLGRLLLGFANLRRADSLVFREGHRVLEAGESVVALRPPAADERLV